MTGTCVTDESSGRIFCGDHVVRGVAELTLVDDARVTEADVLVVVMHVARIPVGDGHQIERIQRHIRPDVVLPRDVDRLVLSVCRRGTAERGTAKN